MPKFMVEYVIQQKELIEVESSPEAVVLAYGKTYKQLRNEGWLVTKVNTYQVKSDSEQAWEDYVEAMEEEGV